MKLIKPVLITTSILLSSISFASNSEHEEGEKLFKTHCASCHGAEAGNMDLSKRVAPPIAAVRMHYIGPYPDESSFVEAVSSWVENQDESKTLMQGAIRRFNIMPPLTIPKEDSRKIASYIYAGDIEEPEGFKQHVEEEHGSRAKGKGMYGQGQGQHNLNSGMQGKGKMGMHGQGYEKHGMNSMHGQGQEKYGLKGDRGQGRSQNKGMCSQENHSNGMHQKHRGMKAYLFKSLDLTSEQQNKIKSLMQEKHKRLDPVKKELHEIKSTMQKLDTKSADYKSQVFSLADEKAKRVHRMMIEKGEMRMKIESVLTDEQRAEWRQAK